MTMITLCKTCGSSFDAMCPTCRKNAQARNIDDAVQDAWQSIGHDLADAAGACGESKIHVDDLADAISSYLSSNDKLNSILFENLDRFKSIKKAIRANISYGRSYVNF